MHQATSDMRAPAVHVLLALALLLCRSGTASAARKLSQASSKPNIIFILTDDQDTVLGVSRVALIT